MLIARVIINSSSLSTDSLYDYQIPNHLCDAIDIGMRVKVPFGRSNRQTEAYVFELSDSSKYDNLKCLSDFIQDVKYFDKKGTELVEFMRHRYFCSYSSAIHCLMPPGVNMKFVKYYKLTDKVPYEEIKNACQKSTVYDKIITCLSAYGSMSEESLKAECGKNTLRTSLNKLVDKGYIIVDAHGSESVSDTTKTFVELTIDQLEAFSIIEAISNKAPARARVLEILCDNYDIELSELLIYAETSKKTVDALYEKRYLTYKSVVCNDSKISYSLSHSRPKPQLTEAQKNAVAAISSGIQSDKKSGFLIHGVTGSGKTEIYMSVIEETIKLGKDAILLVPEISLTPQMVSQIFARFGDNAAVLHSRLTVKQRYNEWFKIKNGDVKIAVGARSAIFAPFNNLGLIIIDEEHESTYKSEMSPRYDTIEIARYLTNQNNGTLVLASATPSIEDYYKAQNGTYKLIELPERINKTKLPKVTITDMRKELENGNMSIFGNDLKEEISKSLSKKEQIILFLNRRGFSSFVSCRNCGYVMKCPNCNVSLTYHKSANKMVCHYCDYKTSAIKTCPSCGNKHIRFFGIGTEKIVEELGLMFPKAKVIRMDADTTSGRMSHENVLNHFASGDADILVGTQMITKGLDFSNVTLVGIVAADMSLNIDDYRACEKTFDLITQVVGRTGRGDKTGKAVIQTYNPEDETIILSASQDYKSFYNDEINIRRMLMYPPFTEFIKIQFSSTSNEKAKKLADSFYSKVKVITNSEDFIGEIYPVAESPLFKLNGKYRYRFILKTPYRKKLYDSLRTIYEQYLNNKDDVSIIIDINPNNLY